MQALFCFFERLIHEQHPVDQRLELHNAVADNVDELAHQFRLAGEQLQRQGQACDRRAQFVTDVLNEFVLQFIEPTQLILRSAL